MKYYTKDKYQKKFSKIIKFTVAITLFQSLIFWDGRLTAKPATDVCSCCNNCTSVYDQCLTQCTQVCGQDSCMAECTGQCGDIYFNVCVTACDVDCGKYCPPEPPPQAITKPHHKKR